MHLPAGFRLACATGAGLSALGAAAPPARADLTIEEQMRGAQELRERLWHDPARPRYHLAPEAAWNDINGTLYWKGRYHVFFIARQPATAAAIAAGTGGKNAGQWLHASSLDLVHWLHHPPALVPDARTPRGIYSGDAVDGADRPTLIYHVPGQGTCLAVAEDDELLRWKPLPQNPVIPGAGANPEAVIFDPAAWKDGDVYYALIGNKNKRPGYEGDSTSLYRSRDLLTWEYRGPFYRSDRRWTDVTEDCACPDFFPLGDRHVLLMHVHAPFWSASYYIGRWDRVREQFIPESHGRMNWPGGQLSAPETLLDAKGRRIFWGWVREARPAWTSLATMPAPNGWTSIATLPRILSLDSDHTLRIVPTPELEVLRHNPRTHYDLVLEPGRELALPDIRGDSLELALTIEPGSATEVGLKVRCSPDGAEQTGIIYSHEAATLRTELAKSSLDPDVKYPARSNFKELPEDQKWATEQVAPLTLPPGEPLRLRVFIDRSILEVFANDRQCLTQRIYPTRADSLGIVLIARGGTARATSVEAWDMHATNSW